MRRREFFGVLGGVAAWPLAAHAQRPVLPVIGFLDLRSLDTVMDRLRGFRQGLKETGYVEGENVAVDYRFAENQSARLRDLATELIRRQVSVIVTGGPTPTLAAKAATTEIPIIFLVSDDAVRLGLVTSISRPDENLTGINIFNAELATKRLELLRVLVPGIKQVAVIVNSTEAQLTERQLKDVEAAARVMGLQTRSHNADTSSEINLTFEKLGRERPDAVFVAASPFLNGRRVQLTQLAAYHRLPTTYAFRDFVEAGGLMSYGSNIVDAFRQAGVYAGRILKGAKPSDLPVVQSSKFELVINAETARMLGLTLPPSLLSIADEVIE